MVEQILIFTLILLLPHGIIYQETLYDVYKEPVVLKVVERETDMPKSCWENNSQYVVTTGCALFGKFNDKPFNEIYLYKKYLQSKGPYGLSSIYHELLHIQCQCNWHGR